MRAAVVARAVVWAPVTVHAALAITWGWIEPPAVAMQLADRVAAMLWRMSHPSRRA